MYVLSLEASRFTYNVVSRMSEILKGMGRAIVKARQEQANFEIAKMLHRSGDYRNESFDYILHMVRTGKVDELFSK